MSDKPTHVLVDRLLYLKMATALSKLTNAVRKPMVDPKLVTESLEIIEQIKELKI